MEQPPQGGYPDHSHTGVGASSLDHVRSTTYEGIGVGGNAQAHFGDIYQQSHGLVINANNVDINEHVLQQLVRFDRNSAPTRRTFGLCLGQAPQIEQDAFIGRRTELQQIQEWFSQDRKIQSVVSIVGMGGLGKTQLSLAYAREHRDQYTSLFWLNAKDEVSLRQSFSTLASIVLTNVGTTATNTGEEKTQVELVRRWLSEDWNYKWLVIFDNYDDPNLPNIRSATGFDIRVYFPHRTQGHILITTRSPKLTFSKRLRLQKFNDISSGLAVLTQRAGRDLSADVDARPLAIRLDGLPLALAAAGTYLGQTSVSCTEYLHAYESAWTDLYGPGTEELLEYEDRTLSSTWNISLDQVRRVDADAAELLKFWAYFSNKDVWYELIRAGADNGPAWMSRVTANKISFDRAMTKLQDYSLVEVVAGSYSIHPCIHAWVSERFDADQAAFIAALKCDADSVPHHDSIPEWTASKRLLLHIDRLNDKRFRPFWEASMSDQVALDRSNKLGVLLYHWNCMEQAETMYLRAMIGFERVLGPDHLSVLHICDNLGLLYQNYGAPKLAEEMHKRALAGYTKVLGPDNLRTLATISHLGQLCYQQSKPKQAEKLFLRALKGTEAAVGLNHHWTLIMMNDLGLSYLDQGKIVEAEYMLLNALAKKERTLGCNHISTLEAVGDVGRLHSAQGQLDQAEQLYRRALAGMEKAAAPDHTLTLDLMNFLGALHVMQGRLDEAEEVLSRLLSTRKGSSLRIQYWRASIHRFARFVRLIENHNNADGLDGIMYQLTRALFWIKDEENYLIGFSQVRTAVCDGCANPIHYAQGHHICCQCDDVDLCNECMTKYRDESLNLENCKGHDFFDVGAAVSESLGSSRQLSVEQMNTWINRLKEKYPLATDS